MQFGFELRYLRIEWLSEGIAGRIDIAPMPLAIERTAGEEFTAESAIFNDSYPWLGIRTVDQSVPVLVDADGRERAFIRVKCPSGEGAWCVFSDEWIQSRRQHVSELRRSAGVYRVRVGGRYLTLQNYISNIGRDDIQAYVDDFRGNLLWMILNNQSGATAQGRGSGTGEELVPLLEELDSAARRVLAAPAMSVREDRKKVPVNKVRVTTETLREIARDPRARRLTGRVFLESADTPENRYLRHMLALIVKWTRSWLNAASSQEKFLEILADQEEKVAEVARTSTTRSVDPEIFDNQTRDTVRRIEALNEYRGPPSDGVSREREFPINITRRYGGKGFSYFYVRLDGAIDGDEEIEYRVVTLPQEVFELVQSALHVCDKFTIVGFAESRLVQSFKGSTYLELSFRSVRSIKATADEVMAIRAEKRRRLEEAGWNVPLTSTERKEAQREAKIASRRAGLAREKVATLDGASSKLLKTVERLEANEASFAALGVGRRDVLPMGMIFFTNPAYAACISAFKSAAELFRQAGFDPALLEKVESFGVLHASDVYEKWCLVKLCSLLIEDFCFTPEKQWVDRLVSSALRGDFNVRLRFHREDVGLSVYIWCQQETRLGRRPDFVIQVVDSRTENRQIKGGLVLDAKFRRSWGWGSPAEVLQELVLNKGYGEILSGGNVFVLQPCAETVADALSPLEWGRDCNYGSGKSHEKGWIQLGVGSSGVASSAHLKRLLILMFQSSVDAPEQDHRADDETGQEYEAGWLSNGFCIGCGESHGKSGIRWKPTSGGGDKWLFNCVTCGVWTERTRCYSCKAPIFKNGTRWTYHFTFADQTNHVICPGCGSFFDKAYGTSH